MSLENCLTHVGNPQLYHDCLYGAAVKDALSSPQSKRFASVEGQLAEVSKREAENNAAVAKQMAELGRLLNETKANIADAATSLEDRLVARIGEVKQDGKDDLAALESRIAAELAVFQNKVEARFVKTNTLVHTAVTFCYDVFTGKVAEEGVDKGSTAVPAAPVTSEKGDSAVEKKPKEDKQKGDEGKVVEDKKFEAPSPAMLTCLGLPQGTVSVNKSQYTGNTTADRCFEL